MTTLYHWMAAILAGCWAVTHNYALAIALLTIAVVAVTTPLTWKSTRGMLAMQMLAPEIKKLQQKYKNDKEALNREMMALYKENNINPLGGCLPLLPQMLVFFVLYRTIFNLAHRMNFTVPKGGSVTQAATAAHCPSLVGLAQQKAGSTTWTCAAPQNVSHGSGLYHNLIASGGHMKVWGFDLTLGVRTAHGASEIGYWILVVLVVGAYYIQTKQMSSRNPAAAAANPQMQSMQKIFPLFFGLISITIQAGVNIYFLVSALCRIGQQALMYRHDPILRRHVENARLAAPIEAASRAKGSGERKGFFASLMPPAPPQPPAKGSPAGKGGGGRSAGPRPSGGESRTGGQQNGGQQNGGQQNGGQQNGGGRPVAAPPPERPEASGPTPAGAGGQESAPRSTLSRLWAAASGAAPPPAKAPGAGSPAGPAGGPGEPPAPPSSAEAGGAGAPKARGNGSGPSAPSRNGRNGAANRAPRPNQSNRSRAKRSRRPR